MDAQPFQPFLDLVAQTVGVAEDAVVIKDAAVDVLGQKGVEGVEARLVQQIERVEGEVLFPAGGLKAHPALVGLAGDP